MLLISYMRKRGGKPFLRMYKCIDIVKILGTYKTNKLSKPIPVIYEI